MVTGTGEWWARFTATEPTMRCMTLDELPTSMTTTSSGRAVLTDSAAEQLGDSQVPWDFQWRQGLIAHELIAVAESVQAAQPDDVVVIVIGSSSSAMHRMVGSVAVSMAHHAPVPVTIVP